VKAFAPYRLWLPVALLILVGFVAVASAGDAGRFAKQLVWAAAGTVLAVAVIVIGLDNLIRYAWHFYAAGLAALVLVLFTRPVNDVRAWFDLGAFKVQPAELFRPILLLVLASFLGGRMDAEFTLFRGGWRREAAKYFFAAALVLPPVVLVLLEPDVGVALALLWLAAAVVFASGISWRMAAAGTAACSLAAAAACRWMLLPSQKARISAWLDPAAHSAGAAWQMLRSRLAVGSGGFWGKGWGRGEMNRLGLLPVNDSDFIFSVVAEELGFATVMIITALYVWILWECVLAAARADKPSGMLVAVGVGCYLAGQAALNMGVAVGLLPTTGVTLPFVSYGGSSMVSNMVMVAMAVSAAAGARSTRKGGEDVV